MNSIEYLPWDSEFFGVSIGRVRTAASPLEAVREANTAGIDCLYFEQTVHAADGDAASAGFTLVERRVALVRLLDADDAAQAPVDAALRLGTEGDLASLGECLDALAPWSRFAGDPRFGLVAARRMHEAWLKRSIKAADEALWLAEIDGGVAGCVTVGGSLPEIGLIAAVRVGMGVGRRLMQQAVSAAAQTGARALHVRTQADNETALRFYRASGFVEESRSRMFHWWRSP